MGHIRIGTAALLCTLVVGCSNGNGTDDPAGSRPAPPPALTTTVTANPVSPVGTVVGTTRHARIVFSAPANMPATNLTMPGPGVLPEGWTATPTALSCSTVSDKNDCALDLAYAPVVATGPQTLSIAYRYTDSAGALRQDAVSLQYSAVPPNAVTGSATPAGSVTALVNGPATTVTVSFATNDGSSATGLTLGTSLAGLPSGWSAAAPALACDTVDGGTGCSVKLQFAPTTAATGTVAINFDYVDSAGKPRSGTVEIPYVASVSSGSVLPLLSQTTASNTAVGFSTSITLTFQTSDGTTATGFSMPVSLPAAWSASSGGSTFACGTVNTGAACQLTLTYTPTAATAPTSLALNYVFTDSEGRPLTGTVTIPYSAAVRRVWNAGSGSTVIHQCRIGTAGVLSSCGIETMSGVSNGIAATASHLYMTTGSGAETFRVCQTTSGSVYSCSSVVDPLFLNTESIAINADGTFLVATSNNGNSIFGCDISGTGQVSGCVSLGPDQHHSGLAIHGSRLYIGSSGPLTQVCVLDTAAKALRNCTPSPIFGSLDAYGFAFSGAFAYVVDNQTTVLRCNVTPGGVLISCADTGELMNGPASLVALNGHLFIGQENNRTIKQCGIDPVSGALSNCQETGTSALGRIKVALQ